MNAFIEILSGVIRFGPDCHRYLDPYEGAIAFSATANVATLKGLVIPKDRIIHPDGTITLQRRYTLRESRDLRDVVHLRCRELGLEPIFERAPKLQKPTP